MKSRRQAIEIALAGWRAAERELADPNADFASVRAELERWRDEFQRLANSAMFDQIAALQEAESRRSSAMPSTFPFHQAAQDEKVIAAEIWDQARSSDEDTPQTRAHARTSPAPGGARGVPEDEDASSSPGTVDRLAGVGGQSRTSVDS
jgi:hypothetical protein